MIIFPQSLESKFRFVTMAAQRCEQLIRGAQPHLDPNSEKNTTIAVREVLAGLVEERGEEPVVDVLESELGLAVADGAAGEELPSESIVIPEAAPPVAPPAE